MFGLGRIYVFFLYVCVSHMESVRLLQQSDVLYFSMKYCFARGIRTAHFSAPVLVSRVNFMEWVFSLLLIDEVRFVVKNVNSCLAICGFPHVSSFSNI